MEKRFLMFTKTSEKWPLLLFNSDSLDAKPLENLMDIKQSIIDNNGLYYSNTNKDSKTKQFVYRSQITSIYGPYTIPGKDSLQLEHVMSLNEAANRWKNISRVDTIRKAIASKRFYEWEARKSESIWVVTYGAMTRIFGPEDYTKVSQDQILPVQRLNINEGDIKTIEDFKHKKFDWIDVLEGEGDGSND